MPGPSSHHIAVFPGDGIGIEVMASCVRLIGRLRARDPRLALDLEFLDGGAGHYARSGTALPEASLTRAEKADAILFGAMGLPHVRYPDGREIAPQLDLRETFDLYAGVRPVRAIAGTPLVLADERARRIDFVLVRESTEGLFSHRLHGTRDGDRAATDVLEVTRPAVEKVSAFAFRLAARRGAGRRLRHLRRQGQRPFLTRLLPEGVRRGCRRHAGRSTHAICTWTPPPSISSAGRGTSMSSSPRTCSATSSPISAQPSSGGSVSPRPATSATGMPCSSPATAAPRTSSVQAKPIRSACFCRRR